MSNPIQTTTVVIPAGVGSDPGTKSTQLAGKLFGCVATTQPFRMKFDAGTEFDCIQGAVIPVPEGFKGVTFLNYSGTQIVVQIFVGVLGITIIPTNSTKVYPTYPKGTDLKGISALGAGAGKDFGGLDGLNMRKQITVQNLDAGGNNLEVLDYLGNSMALVQPFTPPWTLECGGKFTVKNTSAAGLSRVVVGEVFYSS